MLLRTRILRDLLAGQSTVTAMAIRFEKPHVEVREACDELELDLLITCHPVGDAFFVYRLTQAGREEATNPSQP